jgi:hypothetical protein
LPVLVETTTSTSTATVDHTVDLALCMLGAGYDWTFQESLSHLVLEGKPNANYVRARIRIHVHSGYINEHQRTLLK